MSKKATIGRCKTPPMAVTPPANETPRENISRQITEQTTKTELTAIETVSPWSGLTSGPAILRDQLDAFDEPAVSVLNLPKTWETKTDDSDDEIAGNVDAVRKASWQAAMAPESQEEQYWIDNHRKQASQYRANVLRYTELEDMVASQTRITRRHIVREVVAKHQQVSRDCCQLPLNIFFFALFAMSARLHEDIGNVWLMESAMRHRFDASLSKVNTIGDVWAWLETDLVPTLFVQKNNYGEDLPFNEWGRTLIYSQVQGSLVIEQSRASAAPWGLPYTETVPDFLASIHANNSGFIPNRRLRSRRLNAMTAMWMTDIATQLDSSVNEHFDIYLYPILPQSEAIEQLRYYEKRQWLDKETTQVRIVALLLNGELGRPRLEQLSISLAFSRGGGIFPRLDMQCLFLLPFHEGFDGLFSMGCDALLVLMLAALSLHCLLGLWNAFIESELIGYLAKGFPILEVAVMTCGWAIIIGFVSQITWIDVVTETLQVLRQAIGTTYVHYLSGDEEGWRTKEKLSADLHAGTEDAIEIMELIRTGIAVMTLLCMFRFFLSFKVQPRLAVVTRTLNVLMIDLVHFGAIYLPTFFGYAFSGNILFGRRLEIFSTAQGSIGVCLRMAFENEFEWLQISEEFFWLGGLWCWSYMTCVVLILMNMVLAIVLDVYNEVRNTTDSSATLYLFFSQLLQQLRGIRRWVKQEEIACLYGDGVDDTTQIDVDDVAEAMPQMSRAQRDILMNSCKLAMAWQAKQELASSNHLMLAASIKLSVDGGASSISKLDHAFDEFDATMRHRPTADLVLEDARMAGVSRAFPGQPQIPGGSNPPMCPPTKEEPGVVLECMRQLSDDDPPWYRNLKERILSSGALMERIQYDLQKLHYMWHRLDFQAIRQGEEDAENSATANKKKNRRSVKVASMPPSEAFEGSQEEPDHKYGSEGSEDFFQKPSHKSSESSEEPMSPHTMKRKKRERRSVELASSPAAALLERQERRRSRRSSRRMSVTFDEDGRMVAGSAIL